jgi:outer membrane protein
MTRFFLFLSFAAVSGQVISAAPDPTLSTSPKDGIPFTRSEAEAYALKNNPLIASKELTADAVRQTIREARSGLFPQISADSMSVYAPSNTRLTAIEGLSNPSIYTRQSDGFMLSQLLFDFGKTFDLTAAATSETQAAEERTQTIRALILLEVDRAYFNVLRSQALLQVAQKTVEARTLLYRQVNTLMQSQLKSELDLSFVEVDLAKARLQVIQAQSDIRQSEAELSAAIGFNLPQHFKLAEDPRKDPVPESDQLLMFQALKRRPEIAALRYEIAADEKRVVAAKKDFLPTASALVDTGVNPAYDPTAIHHAYYAAGINVQVPVFTGGYLDARVKEARLTADAAIKSEQDTENTITRDVREAWLFLVTTQERISVAQDLVKSADEALRLATARYQLGTTSIVELSQAQLNDTEAQLELASARYDLQSGQAELEFTLGSQSVHILH